MQDLVGVLAERRHRPRRRPLAVDEERAADRRDRPDRRADLDDEPVVGELRMLDDLGDSFTAPQGMRAASSMSSHSPAGRAREQLLEQRLEQAAVLDPHLVRGEARIVEQVGPVDDLDAERAPVLGGEDGEAEEPPVARREGAVGAEVRVAHARAPRLLPPVPPEVREVAEPVDHRVEERDGDSRALAGLRAARRARPASPRPHSSPRPRRTTEMPTRAGSAGVPVTAISPVSPCMTRS